MDGANGRTDARNILAVRDLRVRFPRLSGLLGRRIGWTNAVDGVSFEIESGRTLGLVGESGCGKTTVGRAVLGLIPVAGGAITFDGVDLRSAVHAQLRRLRRELQIVFQDPGGSLNPRMRIGAIVGEPLIVHGVEKRGERLRERVGALLERCGMPGDCVDRFPHQFSGGQKQRIAIARAIALQPKLIVCDEPTSALDQETGHKVMEILRAVAVGPGRSLVIVTHDARVFEFADRIAKMNDGHVERVVTSAKELR